MKKIQGQDIVGIGFLFILVSLIISFLRIELKTVEDKVLNKYGRMRREYLQELKPMVFDDLVLTEQLFPHLYEVQEIAEKRVEVIMDGLLEKNPAPDKETDAMAWVGHMNLLKTMAEEVVVREVIYT